MHQMKCKCGLAKNHWFQLGCIWSASKFNGFGHGGWFMIDLLTLLLWWFIFIFTQSFSNNNDYFLVLLMRKSVEIPKSEMALKISFCIFFLLLKHLTKQYFQSMFQNIKPFLHSDRLLRFLFLVQKPPKWKEFLTSLFF